MSETHDASTPSLARSLSPVHGAAFFIQSLFSVRDDLFRPLLKFVLGPRIGVAVGAFVVGMAAAYCIYGWSFPLLTKTFKLDERLPDSLGDGARILLDFIRRCSEPINVLAILLGIRIRHLLHVNSLRNELRITQFSSTRLLRLIVGFLSLALVIGVIVAKILHPLCIWATGTFILPTRWPEFSTWYGGPVSTGWEILWNCGMWIVDLGKAVAVGIPVALCVAVARERGAGILVGCGLVILFGYTYLVSRSITHLFPVWFPVAWHSDGPLRMCLVLLDWQIFVGVKLLFMSIVLQYFRARVFPRLYQGEEA